MNTSGFSAVVKQIYQYEEVKCIEMHLLSSEVVLLKLQKLDIISPCFRPAVEKKGIETRMRAHHLYRGSY